MRRCLGTIVITLALVACGGGGALTPRPSVVVEGHHDTTLQLSLGSGVPDDEPILSSAGVSVVTLGQWRQTLRNGFDAGFAKWFKLTHGETVPELTLEIATTVLTYVPSGGPEEMVSLGYRARLIDKHGTTVGTSSGTVNGRPEPGVQTVTRAVEAMYEQLTGNLFNRPAPEE